MKVKIVEILKSYGVFSEFYHEKDEWRNKIADEILELFPLYKQSGELTLHWSPDTGCYYWNDKGQLSKAFDTVEEAVKNKEGWERMGTQFSRWLRLGMAIDWEKT